MSTTNITFTTEQIVQLALLELEHSKDLVITGGFSIQDFVVDLHEITGSKNIDVRFLRTGNSENARILFGNQKIFVGEAFAAHPSTQGIPKLRFS